MVPCAAFAIFGVSVLLEVWASKVHLVGQPGKVDLWLAYHVSWILSAERVVCLTLSLAARGLSLKSWTNGTVTGKGSSCGRAICDDGRRTIVSRFTLYVILVDFSRRFLDHTPTIRPNRLNTLVVRYHYCLAVQSWPSLNHFSSYDNPKETEHLLTKSTNGAVR